jgi:phosphoglycolate phosphatase
MTTDSLAMERDTVQLVLFDLDGTFADTAPDLSSALNRTLERNGRNPLSPEQIRPYVSHGGMAMIRAGFGIEPDHPKFENYRNQFLETYRQNIAWGTTLFPGMEQLLEALEQRGVGWGIVTNKPAWLTDPLMQRLDPGRRAVSIVSGDTLEERKPHPRPILYACEKAGIDPAACLYVGDAERDIQAGRAAGATTLAALFGYISEQDQPEQWGADGTIEHPLQILEWLVPH